MTRHRTWSAGSARPAWSAGTLHAARVQGFDPAIAGLHFDNRYPDAVIALGPWEIKTPGLCGGMCCLVLDCFYGRRRPPTTTTTPAVTSRLGAYIQARQWDSVLSLNGPRIGVWIAEPIDALLAAWTLEEWPKLRAAIDANRPVPLALIAPSLDPANSHQVVAYGYREDQRGRAVLVWDPNAGGAEIVQRPGTDLWIEPKTHDTWRGWFVEVYAPKTPPPEAIV